MISDNKKYNSTVKFLPEEACRTLNIDFFYQERRTFSNLFSNLITKQEA